MKLVKNGFALVIFALLCPALLGGCPRGGQTDGTTTDGTPRTGAGAPVSAETEAGFAEAYESYLKAMQTGLDDGECNRLSKMFEKVSSEVEGGLSEALFNAGKIWDKCSQPEKARGLFDRANEAAKIHSKGKMSGYAPALI